MTIEAVIFDLGNVFLDISHATALRKLHGDDKGAADRWPRLLNERALLQRFECGGLTTAQFHAEACALAGLPMGLEAFCEIYCDIFSPVEEMIEANARLRGRGMRTYLFSNTSELHFSHIRKSYDFIPQFDAHFLSYEIGCMKPGVASYEAVERGTGCGAGKLLYVDDLPENIEAAQNRGWRAIHHTSPRETLAKLREVGLL